jgi:hypothetical protein
MPERVSTIIRGRKSQESTIAGMIRCSRPPLPEVGSRRNLTEKKRIIIIPIQNAGTD